MRAGAQPLGPSARSSYRDWMSSFRRSARSVLATASLTATALALAGCLTVNIPASGPADEAISPVPFPSLTDDGRTRLPDDATQDCAGQPVTIAAEAGAADLTGDCPSVTVNGADRHVDLSGAAVGELILRGDRIEVDAGVLGTLEIGGQDNEVTASTIGGVSIRGDRNEVSATGQIGSVMISGNDNDVDAQLVGSVEVSGGGNEVGQD